MKINYPPIFSQGVFVSKGILCQLYCGYPEPRWCIVEHNGHKIIKVFDSFNHAVNFVYPGELRYWRNPTKQEIAWGMGALHCGDFDPLDVVKKDGSLKKWFKKDGKRWYR